jgi:hypothetical protein
VSRLRIARRLLGIFAVMLVALAATTSGAAAKPPTTCSGTFESPGILSGTYQGNVTINGICAAPAGPAVINGNLMVSPGSGLNAALSSGNVTVRGNVIMGSGSIMFLGCLPSSFACFDDPNQEEPTLSSASTIKGNLIENSVLGVVVHNSTIGGNVQQNGGGGGTNCESQPPAFSFGVFSDYEDSTIGGNVNISGLRSCWLGLARDNIGGNMILLHNQLADPDAIEILGNHIGNNLNCQGNSMVWNSNETSEEGLFPREPHPNTARHRIGQCVLSSPLTEGGPVGPGPF